jgi:hypothetical protein
MKRALVAATFVTALCFAPWQATAATELASAPLPPGEGGLLCACTNLTNKPIVVDFRLTTTSTSTSCSSESIESGQTASCDSTSSLLRNCRIAQVNGKALSAKQLACSLSALDAAGRPTTVVPVDKKLKFE